MKRARARSIAVIVALSAVAGFAAAQAVRTESYKPSFVPPAELVRMLGAREAGGRLVLAWNTGGGEHAVELRCNESANLVFLSGSPDDVAAAQILAHSLDVAPRQIAIEARIVEVDTDRAKDLGIDWNQINLASGMNQNIVRRTLDSYVKEQIPGSGTLSRRSHSRDTQGQVSGTTNISLNTALHVLQDDGAATYRDAPRVLTLNNREATIFDGAHVTYINRAAGYSNIFETEVMDAGLKLEVLPSLVESGLLRLQLHAELTTLSGAAISGSPIKSGQVVDNVIMARDGETILLGGFTRTVDSRNRRKFPVLGSILPFLFTRDQLTQSRHETLIAITPRVVELGAPVDGASRRLLEGK